MNMKTKFIMGGNEVFVFGLNEETALDQLKPKVYTVSHDIRGYFLTVTKDRLEVPKSVYGPTPRRVQKCIDTYNDRSSSTGILLTGDKGTGKSLFMSLLANAAMDELGIPVIIVKDGYSGQHFTSFIESLGECCLVFDEFAKVYSGGKGGQAIGGDERPTAGQDSLLTLIDGIDKTKRMFIFTENRELDINEYVLNRPSRVYYHFRYKKLDEESILGYCADFDVSADFANELAELSRRARIFSFDMLQTIVEEHIRYGATIEESIADLNIEVHQADTSMVEIVKIMRKGTNETVELSDPSKRIIERPTRYTYISVKDANASESEFVDLDDDNGVVSFHVNDSDLAYEHNTSLVYDTSAYVVVCNALPTSATDFWKLLA